MLAAGRFTRGGGAGAGITDQAADDKVLALLADGATLVLQALHRTWPPLVEFGTAARRRARPPGADQRLHHPAAEPGFRAALRRPRRVRAAGRRPQALDASTRRWSPTRCADQRGSSAAPRSPPARPSEPLIDTVLEPGDALYLPRGTIHAAQALGEISIHLTVGVHPVTRYQLVRHLLDLGPGRPGSCGPRCRWASTSPTRPCSPPHLARHARGAARPPRRHRAGETSHAASASTCMRQTRPEPIAPLAQLAARRRAHSRTRRCGCGAALRLRLDSAERSTADRHCSTARSACRRAAADAVKALLTGAPITPGRTARPRRG